MYGLTEYGEIIGFDFSGPSVKQKVVLDKVRHYLRDEAMHIVQTPCGDLLQIWWDYKHLKVKDASQPELNPLEEDEDVSEPETESESSDSDSYTSQPQLNSLEENDDVSEPGTESESDSEFYTSQPELNSLEEDDNFSESERALVHSRFYSILSKVYRVDLTSNKPVEITSLGENVLFLGKTQSLCLRAQDHPQLKANHIYITDLDPYIPVCRKNGTRDIGVLNLGNKSREEIVCPQLWSN
ncbi:hypothetical protein QOZ80_6BG0503250 [Eleusine coracana subsp. coracana]|nr:hypothetical protein QOZ80_6BG0503250 [Eleusine coracana subsp. coracana]